jgi:hypothetical protein
MCPTSVWLVNSLDASALIGLWDESPLDDPYVEQPPSEPLVLSIEEQLGYRLPSPYKELARLRNGGLLRRNAHPCRRRPGLRTTSQSLASSPLAAARSTASAEVLAKRSG